MFLTTSTDETRKNISMTNNCLKPFQFGSSITLPVVLAVALASLSSFK